MQEVNKKMKINIYQIYYNKDQIPYLDKDLIPYDNTVNENREFAEYWVFLENYRKEKHKEADYAGFVSWKFCSKTRVGGKTFIDFIKNNPGYDVYFINPSPDNVDLFPNVWYHGEKYHPGIVEFTQKIMDDLNYNINLKEFRNDDTTTLYCNYWVGNEFFWDEYMKFTLPIYDYINRNITPETKDKQESQHTWAQYHGQFTYSPFIFEKLFSTLLVYRPNIKALGYEYPEEYRRLIAETNQLYQTINDFQLQYSDIASIVKKIDKHPFMRRLLSLIVKLFTKI